MFASLDFSTFLICFSEDLSGNKSEEKASVAICGGLSHNLAEIDWPKYGSPLQAHSDQGRNF